MSTDVNLLGKGLKQLGILVFLFIAAPISLTIGFKALNTFEGTPKIYIAYAIVFAAALLLVFTVYFAFKAFKTLRNAIFQNS